MIKKRLLGIWRRFFPSKKIVEYSIGIYKGDNPFNMKSISDKPVLTKEDVTDKETAYVADPFMIKVKEIWYMFFEVRESKGYETYIAYATSKDLLNWRYQKIILEGEPIQSYPYVFEYNGKYYLLPEGYRGGAIRLYKATEFPNKWELCSILIKGKYADPTIFRYNNKWWLFASSADNSNLYLFYSDNLKGKWKEHKNNPIIKGDSSSARPAGRIIKYNGYLYRFAQDCKEYYGKNVKAFKITNLTETEYKEEEKGIVLKGGTLDWNSKGMHTFDSHQLKDGSWIAAVDGYTEKKINKINK